MARYSCLIIGLAAAILLLLLIITCRITGLPLAPADETVQVREAQLEFPRPE